MKPVYTDFSAVWCDPAKFPQWKTLPNSYFDYRTKTTEWNHSLLEFRFFYDWDSVSDCFLEFSAGCRFRLLINGEFVEDGPVEPGGDYGKKDVPDWWFFDYKNVKKWLVAGKNEFRFQVIPVPIVQSDYTTGFGWVWCRLNNQEIPVSEWQFHISSSYFPNAWEDREVKESDWTADCVPVTVTQPLYDLDLPELTNKKFTSFRYLFPFGKGDNVKHSGKKILVKPGRPATLFLELPKESAGHFEVRAKGNSCVHLFMEFQELYGVKPDMIAQERFLTKPGVSSYRTFRIYGFRYVRIDLITSGFGTRYDAGEVELEFIFWKRAFPLGRKRTCKYPEKWMKQLDDHCLNAVEMCMQRFHLDSPVHHEGLGCFGDYRICSNIAASAYNENRLARADLIRAAFLLRQQGKMFHTSYELCYVLMLKEFMDHGGDFNLIQDLYDTALPIIYRHYKSMYGSEGLISEAENYLFIDWVVDGDVAYHHPPANRGMTAMTALWYGALRAMADIASWLGELTDCENFLREASSVRSAFNKYLWDPEQQAYVDGIPGMSKRKPGGWLPPDDGVKICTSIGNAMALAFGLPEETHQPERLLKRVIDGEFRLQPTTYYMEYLLMAADRYQLSYEDKSKLLVLWKPFMKEGIREAWIAGDYCHAWSASPAYWMRKPGFF